MSRATIVIMAAAFGVGVFVQESTAQRYRAAGQEVVPAYEGWERNPDGSFNLVFGTMNRNWEQELTIPIGPDNHVEPGGPDQGQPTQFLPRRNRFLFRVRVPAEFGDNEVVWTLTSPNGETYRAYATLNSDYFIDNGVVQRNNGLRTSDDLLTNKPPALRVEGATTRTVQVGHPVTLTAFASDDGLPKPRPMPSVNPARPGRVVPGTATGLRVSWFVYRGAGQVVFDPQQTKVWEDTRANSNSPWGAGWKTPSPPPDNTWAVTATFSEPGTFVLRCLAHDGGLTTHEDITFVVK